MIRMGVGQKDRVRFCFTGQKIIEKRLGRQSFLLSPSMKDNGNPASMIMLDFPLMNSIHEPPTSWAPSMDDQFHYNPLKICPALTLTGFPTVIKLAEFVSHPIPFSILSRILGSKIFN